MKVISQSLQISLKQFRLVGNKWFVFRQSASFIWSFLLINMKNCSTSKMQGGLFLFPR